MFIIAYEVADEAERLAVETILHSRFEFHCRIQKNVWLVATPKTDNIDTVTAHFSDGWNSENRYFIGRINPGTRRWRTLKSKSPPLESHPQKSTIGKWIRPFLKK